MIQLLFALQGGAQGEIHALKFLLRNKLCIGCDISTPFLSHFPTLYPEQSNITLHIIRSGPHPTLQSPSHYFLCAAPDQSLWPSTNATE